MTIKGFFSLSHEILLSSLLPVMILAEFLAEFPESSQV